VPEPDDAGVVEQEDPVADGVGHVRGLLPFGGRRACRGLGGLQPARRPGGVAAAGGAAAAVAVAAAAASRRRSWWSRAVRTAAPICVTRPSKSSSCSSLYKPWFGINWTAA